MLLRHASQIRLRLPGSLESRARGGSRSKDDVPLSSKGFTLEDVKNLLGHSSIVLTSNTYGHVLEQRQRAVAMGMDAILAG